MALPDVLSRSKDYFESRVIPWWQGIVCNWTVEMQKFSVPILLAGVFLTLRELLERIGQGGSYFRITPYPLVANDPAIRVLSRESQGLARRVFVWVDSAVGGPDPRIRIGTERSGVFTGGVQLTPGVANEVGKLPPNTELWMASDVSITVYVVEEA